ncbi:MAG: TIGR00282 family metallophosphoesterase [Alphaproteobacteria bacterium]
MRILFLGDVVGRSGRTVISERLPDLRRNLSIDFVIANGENAAAGFGITGKILTSLFGAGVDVVTGGNHSFDQREIMGAMDGEPRLMRPLNYPADTVGKGAGVFTAANGKRVGVLNLMGQVFMPILECPYQTGEKWLATHRLGRECDALVVDFHGEATAEKMSFAHFVDGRASLVVGTHTHIPTADQQILPRGTAYMSDAGMCGDYVSVIGMEKDEPVRRALKKTPGQRFTPAKGPGTMCGVLIDTDDATGLTKAVFPIRLGGALAQTPLPA